MPCLIDMIVFIKHVAVSIVLYSCQHSWSVLGQCLPVDFQARANKIATLTNVWMSFNILIWRVFSGLEMTTMYV